MQCRCERCGAAFEGSGERRFCDACLKKIRTEQTHACKRTCAICGQEFVGGLQNGDLRDNTRTLVELILRGMVWNREVKEIPE